MTLKTARQLKGLTQEELAVAAGVDPTTISKLETERRSYRRADYETIVRICRLGLGIEPEELFPVSGEEIRATAEVTAPAAR